LAAYIPPQLCTAADRPPIGSAWRPEIKYDGYRTQLVVAGGRAWLFSRNGLDWTHRYPELAQEAAGLPNCVIDGEVVVLDEQGRSDFEAFLASLSSGRTSDLVLMAVDVLMIEGEDLRSLPYEGRRARLEALLDFCDGPACDHIAVVDSHRADGPSPRAM
jgi:bifunctional non-homologous end joining protein LigD